MSNIPNRILENCRTHFKFLNIIKEKSRPKVNLSNSTTIILLEILLVRCETFVFIFFISITLYLISFSFILYIRFLDKASMQLKEGSFAID